MVINSRQERELHKDFIHAATVSILTATINESGNIRVWLEEILSTYHKFHLDMIKEIIIVDDGSTDGTIEQIEEIKGFYPIPIRLVRRSRRMGTLNAQITGARLAFTDYVLVMDCDMQHPPSFITEFIVQINYDQDIVVGSRYLRGGLNKWPAYRGFVSRIATALAHIMIKNSRKLKDPLSGYFIVRREILSRLIPYKMMYKPLLYVVSMNKDTRLREIPIRMDSREKGESKIVTSPVIVIIRYIKEILIFFRDSYKNQNV